MEPAKVSNWAKAALVLVLLVLAGGPVLFKSFTISSDAMAPTLLKGDHVVASNFAYGGVRLPERGDLVVFRRSPTGASYIKRLIGLPGDTVQVKQGMVYLNGKSLPRQELSPTTDASAFGFSRPVQRFQETLPNGKSYVTYSYGADGDVDNTGVYVVPAGHYFMMGDNRDNSADSRYPAGLGDGYVPAGNIKGRIDLILALGRPASAAERRRFVQFPK